MSKAAKFIGSTLPVAGLGLLVEDLYKVFEVTPFFAAVNISLWAVALALVLSYLGDMAESIIGQAEQSDVRLRKDPWLRLALRALLVTFLGVAEFSLMGAALGLEWRGTVFAVVFLVIELVRVVFESGE